MAGGYWLQAPYGIGDWLPRESCKIILECNGQEWEVVWLVRSGSNGGLSGGWRGFAIDQRLANGDAVVFRKAAGLRLSVTIFRAWEIPGGEHAAADQAFDYAEAGADTQAPFPLGPGVKYTLPAHHVHSRTAPGRRDAGHWATAQTRTR
jgi:hypothetical protein